MSTLALRILHPTDSNHTDGDADVDLTMRDICNDLKQGDFLPPNQQLDQLGATLERTHATVPMTVPLRRLGLQDGDTIQLHKQTKGARP